MTDALDERMRHIRDRFGLHYHASYVVNAEMMAGFAGKRVLEVGGSLPRALVLDELKATSWLGIEETSYYDDAGGMPPHLADAPPLAELPAELDGWQVARGGVENLPEALWGRFDLVFSIAAFEHIGRMPLALDRMYRALAPGGQLVSIFSPIWSAHDGHHLHGVTDLNGRTFTFADSPIPPWGHLLMTPAEMYGHLCGVTDRDAAAEIVYQVYNAPCINRLFTEDYVAFLKTTRFRVLRLDTTYVRPVPPETQAALEARHPGYRHFGNNGLLIHLEKAE
ncbi:MAG: class I SAM-dependent methyltransferase [Actinomycetota bacterium]